MHFYIVWLSNQIVSFPVLLAKINDASIVFDMYKQSFQHKPTGCSCLSSA